MDRDCKLRIARPTDRLAEIADMYERGLGLSRLGHFEDHDGFDGVMLGHPQQTWHLEFTHHRGHSVGRAPNEDCQLVFYVADATANRAAAEQVLQAGFVAVAPYNPYWQNNATTYEDLDGYRVVLSVGAWSQCDSDA